MLRRTAEEEIDIGSVGIGHSSPANRKNCVFVAARRNRVEGERTERRWSCNNLGLDGTAEESGVRRITSPKVQYRRAAQTKTKKSDLAAKKSPETSGLRTEYRGTK